MARRALECLAVLRAQCAEVEQLQVAARTRSLGRLPRAPSSSADAPIGRVRCPMLAIIGTSEPSIGLPDDLEALRRKAQEAPRVELRVLEGADHSYAGKEEELAEVLADWVVGLV